jgi:hypothetical protein
MSQTRAQLRATLQARLGDVTTLSFPEQQYNAAINQAIREAPRRFWQRNIDTALTTIDEQRRYSLAALSLTQPSQLTRAWLEDDDGHDLPMGRWGVEDDSGTYTLVLDEDPPDADLTITLEYLAPHTELTSDMQGTDLDQDWLIAKAATILLLETDPQLDDPRLMAQKLEYFDAMRQSRELELTRQTRRPSGRIRTMPWRREVG